MNDPEIEELLRKTRGANNSEDVQLRVLNRFAELNAVERSEKRVFGWKGVALMGWAVAGIAVVAATLPSNDLQPNPVVTSHEEPLAPSYPAESTPKALTFEIDADAPLRVQQHPWSSTVILVTNMPADHQIPFPVGGRFNETLP